MDISFSRLIRLLSIPLGFTFILIFFRIFYSTSLTYSFFIWNIFLAIVPLGISTLLLKSSSNIRNYFLLIGWLLFFPNALYIVTDLIHLRYRSPIPIWFDSILIFSAAINGLLVGYISLLQVENFLLSKLGKRKTTITIVLLLGLSSFGVYLGRFLRWNSWDVFFNPIKLFFEIAEHIIYPLAHPRTWGMTILLTLFFSAIYYTTKKLSPILK